MYKHGLLMNPLLPIDIIAYIAKFMSNPMAMFRSCKAVHKRINTEKFRKEWLICGYTSCLELKPPTMDLQEYYVKIYPYVYPVNKIKLFKEICTTMQEWIKPSEYGLPHFTGINFEMNPDDIEDVIVQYTNNITMFAGTKTISLPMIPVTELFIRLLFKDNSLCTPFNLHRIYAFTSDCNVLDKEYII